MENRLHHRTILININLLIYRLIKQVRWVRICPFAWFVKPFLCKYVLFVQIKQKFE